MNKSRSWSCQNVMNDIAMYVSQPEITPSIPIGKLFMMEPQCMQNGCVKVVYTGSVFDSLESEVVGGSVYRTAFYSIQRDTAGGSPKRNAWVWSPKHL